MKKIILAALFSIITYFNVMACGCSHSYIEYFCDAISESDYIVLGIVGEEEPLYRIHLQVLSNLNLSVQNEIIVQGQDGINCGAELDMFATGDTVIFALDKIMDNLYILPDACGLQYLSYSNGKVLGNINNETTEMEFIEFEQNLLECQSEVATSGESFDNMIQLFPNPASNQIFIRQQNKTQIQQIKIYTIQGELVSANQNIDNNKNAIDIQFLKSGQYICEIQMEGHQVYKKFLKLD